MVFQHVPLSPLVVVSFAAAISDGRRWAFVHELEREQNLRGACQLKQLSHSRSALPLPAPCRHHLAVPAPAPSIRILQTLRDQEEDGNVLTLSPVIVEYWGTVGDG
jgi:hypothetical protein